MGNLPEFDYYGGRFLCTDWNLFHSSLYCAGWALPLDREGDSAPQHHRPWIQVSSGYHVFLPGRV